MNNKTIGVFIGSLRKESNSRKIAENIMQLPHEGFSFKEIKMDHLPFYNQDFDDFDRLPESFITFRQEVRTLDALLFITPEYNRTIPGVLKNALDVASRPGGHGVWTGKPGGIITSSTGNIGGFGANHHLRQCLAFLNVFVMAQPEAYLTKLGPASFDSNGIFIEERSRSFIQKYFEAYLDWISRFCQ